METKHKNNTSDYTPSEILERFVITLENAVTKELRDVPLREISHLSVHNNTGKAQIIVTEDSPILEGQWIILYMKDTTKGLTLEPHALEDIDVLRELLLTKSVMLQQKCKSNSIKQT